MTGEQLATVVRAVTSFPGTQLVDECPWKRLLDIWPAELSGLGDSVLVAVATDTHCDALATFDRKLSNKLERFSLEPYF